jgi:hypothetical protein
MPVQNIFHHRRCTTRQLIKDKEKILIKMFGLHPVQHITDMVIRWDFSHAEQRLGIILPNILMQSTLKGQKGRVLHEKQRKSRNTYISHGIAAIVPAPLIGH